MRLRWVTVLGLQACMCAAAATAWSAELSKDYLVGSWGVGGVEACGTAGAEQISFNPDGTFGSERGGKATSTGFWFLVEDRLDLHMITSPAFFDDPDTRLDDQLSDFAGQYNYYYATALLFDVADNDFRMVAHMGGMMRGADMGRCPGAG